MPREVSLTQPPFRLAACLEGFSYYYLTTVAVLLGVLLGAELLPSQQPVDAAAGAVAWLVRGQGPPYAEIVQEGYAYEPKSPSSVALFPAYPLAARLAHDGFGLSVPWALVGLSHLSLAAAGILLAAYAHHRYPEAPEVRQYALLALGLYPTGLFFRMAHSDSLFLFLALLAMYGLLRRWPLVVCALVIGLATATRPVGVALLVPFALHVWRRAGEGPTRGGGDTATRRWDALALRRLAMLVILLPLACWGLFAYMAYLHAEFGSAWCFAATQDYYTRRPPFTPSEKWLGLLSLKPFWTAYDSTSPVFWAILDPRTPACFSLAFANPIWFALALVLTIVGRLQRWLDWSETSLAACLLAIPYLTRSFEMGMVAHGRFTSVAFPIYLVIAQLLVRLPPPLAAALAALSAILLAIYSALFSAGYPTI